MTLTFGLKNKEEKGQIIDTRRKLPMVVTSIPMLCILVPWVMSCFGDAYWLYTNHVVSTGFFVNAGSISVGSTDWSYLGRGEGYEISAGFEPYDPPDKPPPDPEDPFGDPVRPKPEPSEILLGTLEVHHNGPHLFITVPFWLLFGLGALLAVICTNRNRTRRRWQARSRRELVDFSDSNP